MYSMVSCDAETRSNVTVRFMSSILPSLSQSKECCAQDEVMKRQYNVGHALGAKRFLMASKEFQAVDLRLGSDSLSFHRRSDKRIRISVLEQIHHSAIHQLQTPLCSLKLLSLCQHLILSIYLPAKLTIPILVFLKLLNLILACCLVPLTQYTTSIFPCSWLISPPI